MIPYGRQTILEKDIQAVLEVLRSDWLTQGPWVEKFEGKLAQVCGARFAVAVSSGTAALHLACLAGGITEGDVVAVPTLTFAASANCVLYCSARPILVDICPGTLLLDTSHLADLCKQEKNLKAVIPVHFAGLPCAMDVIQQSVEDRGATIIEDACHALGAIWNDSRGRSHRVGDCSFSDMTCFSFHPVKHITTGEGGAILTNSTELLEKLRVLRSHGIVKNAPQLPPRSDPWYYEMRVLGFNYRITDFQCALGFSQLDYLGDWVARRRAIADRYRAEFDRLPYIRYQSEPQGFQSSYHLFVVQVDRRKEFFRHLKDRELNVQVHYLPIHLHPYYQEHFGWHVGDFPGAESYYEQAISLPIYPSLHDEQQDFVIQAVKEIGRELGLG
jgi:UDP-4-amino-4,6-dideoxy-N-acetyl-beta-L-altrosamine transaminase